MKRKRKHIPMIEIAASFAAEILERDNEVELVRKLERERVSAATVLRHYTPDHIVLHCWGGADKWHNLRMRRRNVELKLKDRADTTRAAKVKRIDSKWNDFMRRTAAGKKPRKRSTRWPSRPFRSRP